MAEITRRELVLILAAVPHVRCQKPDHLVRLAGVDLSGLDLRGLNLAHADLAGADLRGCDLSDAQLSDADLSGADLTGAVLRGVYANGATFADAVLARADFRPSDRGLFYGTHLRGADFQGADLTGARLGGADLCAARFADADLAGADLGGARMDGRTVLTGAGLRIDALDGVDWAEVPNAALADGPDVAEAEPVAGAWMPVFPAAVGMTLAAPLPSTALGARPAGRAPLSDSRAA